MEMEPQVWSGRPSQITNALTNLGLLLVAASIYALPLPSSFLLYGLLVPVVAAVWFYLVVRCLRYDLTTQRLRVFSGVFSRTMDELELYRVVDIRYFQPWYLRPFGLANVILITNDRSTGIVDIYAINDAMQLREQIRSLVESRRTEKRVRELEVN